MNALRIHSALPLPVGWQNIPLKRSLQRIVARSTGQDFVVALENITSWTGELVSTDSIFDGDGVEFKKNDILFGKLRPYLAKVYLAERVGEAVGDLWVLRASPTIHPSFAAYQLRETGLINLINSSTMGAKMPRAEWATVGSISVPTPPLKVQVEIAEYLDDETARIDRLIKRKHRFIELLEEKSLAIVAQAITGGIYHAKDTIEDAPRWLGQVPSHWKIARVAELFREVVRPADPDLPVLAVSIHHGVSDKELDDEDRARKVNLSEDRTKYQRVQPGDLVYNMMRAWQGAFGTVTVDGLVSPAYVVAEPKAGFRTKFIELQLRTASGAEEVRRYSKGIADFRQRLYWEHFRNLKVCLPSLAEQDEIIAHIETEQARLSLLKVKTERSIELLREHRAALITAAVTGKIDVRSVAAKNMKVAA
jgi:type I restriction enzyme S subunit